MCPWKNCWGPITVHGLSQGQEDLLALAIRIFFFQGRNQSWVKLWACSWPSGHLEKSRFDSALCFQAVDLGRVALPLEASISLQQKNESGHPYHTGVDVDKLVPCQAVCAVYQMTQ